MNTCTLCGNSELQFSTPFFDKENKAIDLAICPKCQAFIPQYQNTLISNAIEHQARVHEEQWKSSTKEELTHTLIEVSGLVKDLQRYLGPPNKDNLILELGAGRGSLLRALLDAGYSAYGCEPAPRLVELARNNYGLGPESLHEMPADNFLQNVVPILPCRPHAFLLWHVLEHLENPMQLMRELYFLLSDQGCLILQLPLLNQKMIYPEHYFLVSHETFNFIANEIGFQVEGIEYDLDNLFVTACLRKQISPSRKTSLPFYNNKPTPSPLAQAILLRDQFTQDLRTLLSERDETIDAQTKLIDDRIAGMSAMDTMIRERDETIAAQTTLINDGVSGMKVMEAMIRERDETIAAQTTLINDGVNGMKVMEAAIRERDETIAAQTTLVDDRVADINAMEKIITESEQKQNDLAQTVALKESEIKKLYDNKFVKTLVMAKLIR